MSVRGILHQLTREKPLPNCCRECESKYDKAEDAIRKEIAREIRGMKKEITLKELDAQYALEQAARKVERGDHA
jgi:hypothetical protein